MKTVFLKQNYIQNAKPVPELAKIVYSFGQGSMRNGRPCRLLNQYSFYFFPSFYFFESLLGVEDAMLVSRFFFAQFLALLIAWQALPALS